MTFDNEQFVTATQASKSFSTVAKTADKFGKAIVTKKGVPQYLIISLDDCSAMDLTHEEKVDLVSLRVFAKYRKAFEELAK